MSLPEVTLYTDGACLGNPGRGGYGVIVDIEGKRKEFSGGFRRTTNSRMELQAAIAGLSSLKEPSRVRLFSDSQYLVKAMVEGWARQWQARGFKKKKNQDLWQQVLNLCDIHQVEFFWMAGHSGQPENERCDQLATQAALRPDLPPDEVFERTEDEQHPPTLF